MPSYVEIRWQLNCELFQMCWLRLKRPVVAVVGGAKVSTKLAVLENLVKQTDMLIQAVVWPIAFWALKVWI